MIGLLSLLLKSLGPELLKMFSEHLENTGRVMTEEELHAKIDTHADAIIARGENWLKSHPPTSNE